MSLVKTRAFILRSIKYSDSSRILTLLTEELGKVTVIQKGGRKLSAGNAFGTVGCLEAMVYIKETRDVQIIGKSGYLEIYGSIEKDLKKLNCLFIALEILNKCTVQRELNREIFELTADFLRGLEFSKGIPEYCLLSFLLRFSEINGIMPARQDEGFETFFKDSGFTLDEAEKQMLKGNIEPEAGVTDDEILSLCRICENKLLEYSTGSRLQKARSVTDQLR